MMADPVQTLITKWKRDPVAVVVVVVENFGITPDVQHFDHVGYLASKSNGR